MEGDSATTTGGHRKVNNFEFELIPKLEQNQERREIMKSRDPKDLEKLWRIIGIALFVLAVILVAGPQLIDLVFPDFR